MCAYDEDIIKDFLEKYDYWYSDKEGYRLIEKDYLESQIFLGQFLKEFPLEKVREMTLKKYATGRGNQGDDNNSFCYWVETKLQNLGEIRGGRLSEHQRFGIYYDAKNGEYKFKNSNWKNPKFGNSVEEVYKNILDSIVALLEAAQKYDYKKIEENILNPLFKNKLTFLYDTEHWIPIYGESDLNNILNKLKIPFDEKEDRVYKRKKLFDFYKALNRQDISTTLFMWFIYSSAGPAGFKHRKKNIDSSKEKSQIVEENETEPFNSGEYLVVEKASTKKGKAKGDPSPEETKEIGRAGEEIVEAYLENHRQELKIKGDIEKPCEDNDGAHYDFAYTDEEGKKIYIEVKATKRNSNNKLTFEMSCFEYEFMLKHKDCYYIYYVNDALNKSRKGIIKVIQACDVEKMVRPSKYKMYVKKNSIKM